MSRRLTAVAAAAVIGVAILPVVPAFASAASTAALTAGSAVYPGADRSFTIRVTNNEAVLVGKTINAIRVNFPVNEAGITLGSTPGTAAGFTDAKSTSLNGTQFNTYRAGSLRPGSSVDITFPATVGAPLAKDLLGDFRVQVSSDNFATGANAVGATIAKVQVLEILQEGLKPVAPAGVTDRSGTSGQAITYESAVKNYSRSALSVTSSLTSAAGDTSSPAAVTVPAGGTAAARIPVTLATATSDRATVFTARATAAGAEAPTKNDVFSVQAPAALAFSNLQPARVKSGVGSAREFTATASKTGTPAVDALSGALTFGSNSCALKGAPTFPAGSSSQQLTYSCASIAGSDGAVPASITGNITDNNTAGYGYTGALGNIVIDNLGPALGLVVALPNDADGDKQTAVGNRDRIDVSGTIANAGDLASNTVRVTLQPNAGSAVVIEAPVSGSGENRTFAGSASPTWDAAATSFTSRVEAVDIAGNTGAFQVPGSTIIDNAVPVLNNPGVVINATTIEVQFLDTTGVAGGCDARMYFVDGRPGRVSSVSTSDGKPCNESGSGGRQLTLSSPLGVDETPTVRYDITAARTLTTRPAKDGAGNDAITQTIETVTNLVPLAPNVVRLDRRNGAEGAAFEPAFFDTETSQYFTNVGGTDALQLTVGGIRTGYTVEVLRAGQVVASKPFTTAPLGSQGSFEGSLLVPLPTTDGLSAFSVRLVSARGNTGPGTPFAVVFERVTPKLGAASISGSTVSVPFSEKVVLGSDFADNWFVSETVNTETGTAKRTVNANSVTANGQTARSLEATLLDPSRFAGADYFLQSGTRYEDRAGNLLGDTLQQG